MSNTCLIHGNGICYSDTGLGYRDGTGCVVSCTCPPLAEAPAPPIAATSVAVPSIPPPLSNLRFSQLPSTRILRHCHRVENYKRPEDLPPTAHCLCGECTQQPQKVIFRFPPSESDDEHLSNNGGLAPITGGGSTKGSSNSLERTGACTPQCSCERRAEPCGDRYELPDEPNEHDLAPWRRSDSAIGLDMNGNIVKAFKRD